MLCGLAVNPGVHVAFSPLRADCFFAIALLHVLGGVFDALFGGGAERAIRYIPPDSSRRRAEARVPVAAELLRFIFLRGGRPEVLVIRG